MSDQIPCRLGVFHQPEKNPMLWRPYLPAGMLAMLTADPAASKTFLSLAMAAD